jgi:hypothetical protein
MWKLSALGGGVTLGKAAKNWKAGLILGLVAAAVGHVADVYLLPECPRCRGALKAVDGVLSLAAIAGV